MTVAQFSTGVDNPSPHPFPSSSFPSPLLLCEILRAGSYVPGIVRFKYWSNSGTVNAVSPWAGL